MKYFPLTRDRFEHQFGVRALGDGEPIIEATAQYEKEIELKRRLLDERNDEYFQAIAGSESIQLEAAQFVIESAPFLDLEHNTRTAEKIALRPDIPLMSIARHVQEDLAVMSDDAAQGFPLISGCVTFPSGWSIKEKIGQSVEQIHDGVPEFHTVMGASTNRLLKNIKPGRPVWRMNWGVRASPQLDQSPCHSVAIQRLGGQITRFNAGTSCHFRVERQILARLPICHQVLFAIHTHQCPLDELQDWQKRNLLGVLRTCPESTLAYKGILPFRPAITDYLDHVCS